MSATPAYRACRQQRGLVPFGGGDVDRIGVSQRRFRKLPGALNVRPGCGLDDDLEGLGIQQRLSQVRRLERMAGPPGGGHQPGHHFEREVSWGEQRLCRRLRSKHFGSRCSQGPGIGNRINDDRRIDDHDAG